MIFPRIPAYGKPTCDDYNRLLDYVEWMLGQGAGGPGAGFNINGQRTGGQPPSQTDKLIRLDTISAGGWYKGTLIYGGPVAAASDSNETLPDVGEAVSSAAIHVIVENIPENGLGASNWLGPLPMYVWATDTGGWDNSSPPLRVYRCTSWAALTTSPTTINPSTLAADTTTWTRDTNYTPLAITVQMRTYWDTSGAVLYGYSRVFTFDAAGMLRSISAETRYNVDTTTVCP